MLTQRFKAALLAPLTRLIVVALVLSLVAVAGATVYYGFLLICLLAPYCATLGRHCPVMCVIIVSALVYAAMVIICYVRRSRIWP